MAVTVTVPNNEQLPMRTTAPLHIASNEAFHWDKV